MHRFIRFTAFLFCLGNIPNAHASLLTASASVTRQAPDDSLIQQENSTSADFILTFTGGTGQGLFVPILQLYGSTNEGTQGNLTLLGATASLSGFQNGRSPGLVAGDPESSAGFSPYPVSLDCSAENLHLSTQCFIPFTYGQSQLVHLTAEVVAEIAVNPYAPQDPGLSSAAGSVEFYGIYIYDAPVGAVASIDPVPEPCTVISTVLGFAIFGLLQKQRRSLRGK